MAVFAQDGGVVDQDVQPAKRGDGGLHQRIHRRAVGHVSRDKAGDAARGGNLGGDGRAVASVNVGHDYRSPFPRKGVGDGAADALTPARDNGYLVRQAHGTLS